MNETNKPKWVIKQERVQKIEEIYDKIAKVISVVGITFLLFFGALYYCPPALLMAVVFIFLLLPME